MGVMQKFLKHNYKSLRKITIAKKKLKQKTNYTCKGG